jgi:hypothetical protein
MSNINDIVQSAQGGQLIDNLSDRLGLAPWQAEIAVSALAPALSAALRRAAETPDSLRPVLAAIGEPQHKAAYESADSAHSQESVDAGGAIVEQLFGSAAAAGEVSQLAARGSGLRADVLQRLLPVLASILAGGLSSTFAERGLEEALSRASEPAAPPPAQPAPTSAGGLGSALASLLAALFGKPAASAPPQPREPQGKSADALEEAMKQIRQTLAPGAPVAAEQEAELKELLGRIFGSAKS